MECHEITANFRGDAQEVYASGVDVGVCVYSRFHKRIAEAPAE